MQKMTILAISMMLICLLSGCISTGLNTRATSNKIGEMNSLEVQIKLVVARGDNKPTIAILYAENGMGAATVMLPPDDLIKLRDMLEEASSQLSNSDARDSSKSFGIIQSYELSGLALSTTQKKGERTFTMHAIGMYGIPRLHFNLSQEELKELGRLASAAIAELGGETSIPVPDEQTN